VDAHLLAPTAAPVPSEENPSSEGASLRHPNPQAAAGP